MMNLFTKFVENYKIRQLTIENDQLSRRCREQSAIIQELKDKLHTYRIDTVFDVYTRNYIEELWDIARISNESMSVIFLDIDDMKGCNAKWGYHEVNRKVAEIFSLVRGNEKVDIGRYFSGDELLIITRSKATESILLRLNEAFEYHQMSATVVHSSINIDDDFLEKTKWLSTVCGKLKKAKSETNDN